MLVALLPGNSHAGILVSISVDIKPNIDGKTFYSYTLTNLIDSTAYIEGFGLDISPQANLNKIVAPDGWDTSYSLGDNYISFESSNLRDFLSPGSSTVFSFESTVTPVITTYSVVGISDPDMDYVSDQGTILGPSISSVPEPTSMIPLGTGLAAIGGYSLFRRGKTEDHPAASD